MRWRPAYAAIGFMLVLSNCDLGIGLGLDGGRRSGVIVQGAAASMTTGAAISGATVRLALSREFDSLPSGPFGWHAMTDTSGLFKATLSTANPNDRSRWYAVVRVIPVSPDFDSATVIVRVKVSEPPYEITSVHVRLAQR